MAITSTLDRTGLDRTVVELRAGADRWSQLPRAAKRDLLLEVHGAVAEVASEWVEVSCAMKGLALDSRLAGEEWLSGPYVMLAYVRALAQTLEARRDPLAGAHVRTRADGQVVVEVLPRDVYDRLLLNGYRVEAWMGPGVCISEVRSRAGRCLREGEPARVALVLGAGNISSIAPLDVLYKLYADGDVVVLKMNPVNAVLQPVLEHVFASFVRDGFVRFASGGAEVGGYLAHHPEIGAVHMTGSAAVHDVLVFGDGPDGARRKAEGRPLLDKPITSELGGVSPTIVLGGRWSEADLRYQAENVAAQKLHNCGFNCVASQVLVLPDGWTQADRFLGYLREAIRRAPTRPAYYPGAAERQAHAVQRHPDAELLGGEVPRTLLTNLDPRDSQEPAFTRELFAPVLGVTRLPGRTQRDFLDAAVAFSNERLAGTLSANVIADPHTLTQLGPHLDHAVARLRYGAVGVNCWSAFAYLSPCATWGAFPGSELCDVQSGIGVVHNALLLHHPERSIAHGPFRPFPRSLVHRERSLSPKPPWYLDNRTANLTTKRLTQFEASPGIRHLPGIFASALRG
jgi:aldehyde dehydrogenase (NAD(P)+)